MSDLLNQASLVMVPSGYKEDTVYSVVPSDGSGDLSFTRASNGTRINSAGLVEVCPWNLCTYSEQFQNANWLGGGNGKPTMTDNFAEAPNGTMTASKMVAASDGYQLRQNNAQENTEMNLSVWLRTNTGTKTIQLFLNNANTASQNITVTTTWTRYEISGLVTTLSGSGRNGLNTLEALTSSNYILVWGFQLSVGLTAKPYFPTTDRLNVPRLTYQNGGGGCPSLLLEKQSTNIITYSEQFDNAGWNKISATITANAITSPDGTQNADLLNVSSTGLNLYNAFGATANQTHTASIFVKSGTMTTLIFGLSDNLVDEGSASYNLTTLTASVVGSTSWTNQSASIVDYGNGWYRLIYTGTNTSGSVSFVEFIRGSVGTLYVWGAQNEISSYPTSYIPTTSSSATRVADACYKTGISSLFGASATSFFMDFEITQASSGGNWTVTGYDGSNLFSLCQFDTANNYPRIVFDGGVDTTLGTALSIGRHKIAVSFATNDFRAYIDGALVLTDTSCTYNRYDRIGVNGTAWTGNTNNTNSFKLNEYAQFPNILTNAELASLTTI